MNVYHLDLETRSLADLTVVGGWHYARHPSTEILCAAIRRNNEPVLVWSPVEGFGDEGAEQLLREMLADDGPVYAHNATGFEVPMTEHVLTRMGFPTIDRKRWRCTATMARRANIPDSLEKASLTLKLKSQKNPVGKKLIKLFSIPIEGTNQFNDPREHADQFRAFCGYCREDVLAECEIAEVLAPFELKGWLLDIFHEDININGRGMPVNLPALRHANDLIRAEADPAFAEFLRLTGLNPTQHAKLRVWFAENGLPLPNLQSLTLEDLTSQQGFDATTTTGRAVTLLQNIGFASVKKVSTMVACAGPDDNFIRGSLQFYGAHTARWSGRLHQPQNFKTPEPWAEDMTDSIYQHICDGWSKDKLEMWYEHGVIELIAQCIRHFIHDPQGPMLSADYSAIEARVLAWLAGEEWRLEVFRTHGQIYEAGASAMFGIPMQEFWDHKKRTGKHHPMRKKGKVAELACISEGEMVLVGMRGRKGFDKVVVPIQQVQAHHLVWDGANFVEHGGVVWQGYKPVWRWNGLTATEDHVVFTPEGEMTFKQAMDKWVPLLDANGCPRECNAYPEYHGFRPVYDILNCGPLNRFTVSGVLVHNCGYMGSVNALIQFGALREGLTEPELQPIVDKWRDANPNIKKYWFASEDAAVEAVRNPNTWFEVGKVAYGVFAAAGARYLFCRLPSGRRLAYRNPEIRQVEIWTKKSEESGKPWIKDAVFYYGQLPTPGGTKSQIWGMVPLSPGILVENQVQAISFDLMANGTLVAARKGYRIYSLIHDEAMAAWDDRKTQSIEDFQRCLESAPAWAEGLPLGTSGEVVPYYRK
jgi:DNA polymerase